MPTENEIKLQKLIESKLGKKPYFDAEIRRINATSQRIVPNLKTKKNQFRYRSGKKVPVNIDYHIHYTTDFKEYFMTGHNHTDRSLLIYLRNPKSDFYKYSRLSNNKTRISLLPTALKITPKDYENKSIMRYLAKKVNEPNSKPFPISQGDFGSSPLYNYVKFKWAISGKREMVEKFNRKQLRRAKRKMPDVVKVAPLLQFYRNNDPLSKREDALSRLGITEMTTSSGAGSQSQGSGGSSGGSSGGGSGGSSGGSGGSSGGSSGGGSGGGGY